MVLQRVLSLILVAACLLPVQVMAQADPPKESGTSDSAQARKYVDVLLIQQKATGLPGQEPTENESGQLVYLAEGMMKLVDMRTRSIYLLHTGDEPKLWIMAEDGTQYRDGNELAGIQKDRDLFEAQARKQKNVDDEALEKMHIRRDGKREIEKTRTALEEKFQEHALTRYVVKENGRTIVDAKIAETYDTPMPVFHFYRHVGAFSNEVLAALEGIPGIPVEAKITVVTDSLNYVINASVKQVDSGKHPLELFDVPDHATMVDQGATTKCHTCDQVVEKASALQGKVDGRQVWFDRDECFETWRAKRMEEIRKRKKKATTEGTKK